MTCLLVDGYCFRHGRVEMSDGEAVGSWSNGSWSQRRPQPGTRACSLNVLAGPELGEVGFVPAEDGAGLRLKNEASPHAYSSDSTSVSDGEAARPVGNAGDSPAQPGGEDRPVARVVLPAAGSREDHGAGGRGRVPATVGSPSRLRAVPAAAQGAGVGRSIDAGPRCRCFACWLIGTPPRRFR